MMSAATRTPHQFDDFEAMLAALGGPDDDVVLPEVRLYEGMSVEDAILALAWEEGGYSRGAVTVCFLLATHAQDVFGTSYGPWTPWLPLLYLDGLGIYGGGVWLLFKDVCAEHLGYMMAVLTAMCSGVVDKETVAEAMYNRGRGFDLEAVVRGVKEKFPAYNFDFNTELPASDPWS